MIKEMNNAGEQIVGAWKQVRREVHKEWHKLTEIDVEQIKGERSILAAKIEQRYGVARDEANYQIDRWAEGRTI
jgi:uncharacterized protein YjbJ (UPF0337 family)